jgi:hypothetical protein
MTTSFPRRLQLLVAMNDAYARGDLAEAHRLEDLHLAELTGRSDRSDALMDRIAALEARLDARRRVSPGQLEIDLSGGGKGPGGGEPCGNSWIDPNKTCRKNQGPPANGPLPVETAALFSPEIMERLVTGIRNRTFAPPAARHDGVDLSRALQRLAESPGLMGENTRAAMAFMEEARAKVIITPPRTYGPELETLGEPWRWSQSATVDENVAQFRRYVQDRHETAERGRNFAKRAKLWPQELVEAMKADKSFDGVYISTRLDIALNGQPKNQGFAKDLAEFDEVYREYQAATTKRAREVLGEKLRGLNARLMAQSYTSGPEGELEAVRSSVNMALSTPNTMGHYSPRGNTYWKVSMAGLNGAVLHLDEIDPARLTSQVSAAIALPEGKKQFHFSSSKGMNMSESALITHIHELGHMIHDTSSRGVSLMVIEGKEELTVTFREDSMDVAPPNIRAIQRNGQGPTKYSNFNVAELFAESFAAYVLAPDTFKESQPDLYGWVHFALRRARSAAVRSQEATGRHLRW